MGGERKDKQPMRGVTQVCAVSKMEDMEQNPENL